MLKKLIILVYYVVAADRKSNCIGKKQGITSIQGKYYILVKFVVKMWELKSTMNMTN